jgi:hypothetical protein
MRRNVVKSMKEYIQEQILERGLDEYKQIEIDFSGLAEEEEIRQAAKELGYEVDYSDVYGLFWIYEEV